MGEGLTQNLDSEHTHVILSAKGVAMDHIQFICLFVALNVLDAVSTVKVLNLGGRELNPLMRWLMGQIGNAQALVLLKALALFPIYEYGPWPVEMQGLLIAFYVFVVANNLKVLRGLRK